MISPLLEEGVNCLKVICSKNLLDTKITLAPHVSSRFKKDQLLEKSRRFHFWKKNISKEISHEHVQQNRLG